MRVLHIPRSYEYESNLKQYLYYRPRQLVDFWGVNGFFDASLYEAFVNIDRRTAQWVLNHSSKVNENYDVVFIDQRCDNEFYGHRAQREVLNLLAEAIEVPKALFVHSDQAETIPDEPLLDKVDIVFKRECLKDKSQYDISAANQEKIHTTMLSCPFAFHPAYSILRPLKKILEPRPISEDDYDNQEYDVFFSGMISPENQIRETAWKALVEAPDIKTHGGLQDRNINNSKQVKDEKLRGPKLSKRKYIEAIRNSKISLALDGLGEFTFRHLELWYMGAFMICSSNIQKQELPLPIEEGKHYVAYNDTDDLVEKVRHYLDHDEQRLQIAQAGKDMFRQSYDTGKHGEYIRSEVDNIL